MQALAEGWVWDFEIGELVATIQATGENVVLRNSQINSRNARLSIHYGVDQPRDFGSVSTFLADDKCLTGKQMLELFVGSDNVEFERLADDSLVVKRIKTKSNLYADQDFDSLTEVEKAYYGRWVVGFNYHDNRSDEVRPGEHLPGAGRQGLLLLRHRHRLSGRGARGARNSHDQRRQRWHLPPGTT